jgi:hypothetical protein
VKDVFLSANVIAATSQSQASAIPAGGSVEEAAPVPGYVLLNASLLVDEIFDRAYAKVTLMNATDTDYRDYVLSLPYGLPRSGTELYVEGGVRAF